MGSKVKAPKPRDYRQEMMEAMSAQEAIQPRLLALEKQYTPLYQQLQNESLQQQMDFMSKAYEQQIPKAAEVSTKYAQAMAPAFGAIGESARAAYQQTLDPSVRGLLGTLGQQAQQDLTLGSALSAADTQQAQQASRAAMAARGMQIGNQAVALEALNTVGLGQQRMRERQQFASNVYGLGQQQVQQAMGLYGSPLVGTATALSPAGMYQSAAGMYGNLGAQIFQPESQYQAQLLTSNRQEQMQAQMANAQRRAGITGGLLSATGMIVGGMATGGTGFFAGGASAGACWVAREVYGIDNPKWLMFREWLETDSPKWFHELYLEEGERFAEFIKNKPIIKHTIKFMMDLVISINSKTIKVSA